MAFRIVEGVPGSGKSYFIVHWLAVHFCLELKGGGWVLDPSKKVRVITNVAGLQIPHEDFQSALDKAGGFSVFFTKEYQREFSAGFKLIYILDEAQHWFRPKHCKLTHDNLIYFEWARHEGHDIWLLTQHIKKIDFEVACLSEFVVQAQPRSNQIANELTYIDRTFDGTELRVHRLVFSKKIGSLYKSEEQKEAVSIKNHRFRKYVLALVLSFLLMFVGFRYSYRSWTHFMHPGAEKTTSAPVVASTAQASLPVGSSIPSSSSVPPPSLDSAVASATNPPEPQVEHYIYRLDYSVSRRGTYFLLGTSWIPKALFPYPVVKKGSYYFAFIPAILLPALESGSGALPITIKSDKGK